VARSPVSRARAGALILLAYVVALVAAVVAGALTPGGPIVRAFVGDVVATCVIFAFSVRWNNSSFYDAYWSVAPPVIAGYWWWNAGAPVDARAIVAQFLVFVWALRLTWNWARGWHGLGHEDWRYVDIRAKSGRAYWAASFGGIHMFPTLVVFAGCLALYPAVRGGGAPVGLLDLLAVVVTGGAILVEAIADAQLHVFVAQRQPGATMDRGLWAFSRHPNYFGEASFWWGLVVFALATHQLAWWQVVGAATITAMFVFVSIPLMESRSLARRPDYADHQRRVSMIVPWFRRDPDSTDVG
jgi:steroid 5-alpha reductase family enzyme